MGQRYMEILLEEICGKFDLVLEGHESLRRKIRELARRTDERFDLVDLKIESISHMIDTAEQRLYAKIDSVAAGLAAHRLDTHCLSGYRVSES